MCSSWHRSVCVKRPYQKQFKVIDDHDQDFLGWKLLCCKLHRKACVFCLTLCFTCCSHFKLTFFPMESIFNVQCPRSAC